MKLIITEDEKNRILNLHNSEKKSIISEKENPNVVNAKEIIISADTFFNTVKVDMIRQDLKDEYTNLKSTFDSLKAQIGNVLSSNEELKTKFVRDNRNTIKSLIDLPRKITYNFCTGNIDIDPPSCVDLIDLDFRLENTYNENELNKGLWGNPFFNFN